MFIILSTSLGTWCYYLILPDFAVVILTGLALAAPKSRDKSHLNCHEFSRGVKFEDHQAVGSWTLLRLKTENTNSIDNTHCVDFVPVNDKVCSYVLSFLAGWLVFITYK